MILENDIKNKSCVMPITLAGPTIFQLFASNASHKQNSDKIGQNLEPDRVMSLE